MDFLCLTCVNKNGAHSERGADAECFGVGDVRFKRNTPSHYYLSPRKEGIMRKQFLLVALAGAACSGEAPTAPPGGGTTPPPPPTYSWALAAMPALNEVNRVIATPSDSLRWLGRASDALAKAEVSIAVGGEGFPDGCVGGVRIVRLPSSFGQGDLLGEVSTLAHEISHCLAGPYRWAGHTAGKNDAVWGDDGAWTDDARFARARLIQVGEGPVGQFRARIRLIALLKIQSGLPDWMMDPSSITAANAR